MSKHKPKDPCQNLKKTPVKTSTAETQQETLPVKEGEDVLKPIQSLAGQKEMQVVVEINWIQDIKVSDLKSDLEAKLIKNGINVIPYNASLRKPILRMYVTAFSASSYYIVYNMDIQFSQFFPH